MRLGVALALALSLAVLAGAPFSVHADDPPASGDLISTTTQETPVVPTDGSSTPLAAASSSATSTPETISDTSSSTPPASGNDEAIISSLDSGEQDIQLPISYDANSNTYYFSDASPYCDDSMNPSTGFPNTTKVRWYIGAYGDPDKILVAGFDTRDCAATLDVFGVHGVIMLHDSFQYPLGGRDGDRSILIDTGTKQYILSYSSVGGIITAPGSPSYDYHAPFRPVHDSSAEHVVLPATVADNVLALDQSVCDLFLSSVGGLASPPDILNNWLQDHNIWVDAIPPQLIGSYDADNWPSFGTATIQYPMLSSGTLNPPNPACDSLENVFAANHIDLDQLFASASDGTARLFFWWNTKTEPGHRGDLAYMNAHPLGYIELTRANGVWSIGTSTASGASNVLFLPGIEGSVLSTTGGVRLWPPPVPAVFVNTLGSLALDASGHSILPVTVDGLVNTFYGTKIYEDFSSFMDGLVSDGTIKEWKPLAYDWRYSPDKIIAFGVPTSHGVVYPVTEIENLASSSPTGKVSIVAHSYGGLVGKALIKALADKGESNLIDSFVMVGSPQLGTPQAAAALLEGDGESIPAPPLPGIIVNGSSAQSLGLNFESAYDLLPSRHYFDEVPDPVVRFDPDSSFTKAWRDYWGQCLGDLWCINTYDPFRQFLLGLGVPRDNSLLGIFNVPAVLQSSLVDSAQRYHDTFDNYVFPSNIRVVQVAGWGLFTTRAIEYENTHFLGLTTPLPGYEISPTIEGDGTVVYLSTVSAINAKNYFFNIYTFNSLEGNRAEHRNILNAEPVEELLTSVFMDQEITETDYITKEKPARDIIPNQLIVSTHSPVLLGVSDEHGNFTGVNPGQDLNSQFLFTSESIPGSTFLSFGGSEYILLPKDGSYTFTIKGIGSGPATVETGIFSGDDVTPAATYPDIPVTASTQATFTVDSDAPADTHIQVDQNGDGVTDGYVAPQGAQLSLDELLTNLTTSVNNLAIKDKQKAQLLNKIGNIQNKIAKQRQKQSKALGQIEAQILRQAGRGKIDAATANSLATLLDSLIAEEAVIPLDPTLIQQLKDQVNSSILLPALKTSLLNKIARIENLSKVNKSLAAAVKVVTAKGARGLLTDAEAQNLLNLLDQVQNAL